MKKNTRTWLGAIFLVAAVGMSAQGCGYIGKIKAKDRLNKGASAYNRGEYDDALKLLKEAMELDPDSEQVKLFYAATLYAKYSLSGEETFAREALAEYEQIHQGDPANADAVAYIAVIYGNLGDKEKQREWTLKRLELPGVTDRSKAEIYYTLGQGYFGDSFELTQKYRVTDDPPAANVPEDQLTPLREAQRRAMEYLNQAIALDPEYADAYTYLNLTYREQAKIEKDLSAKKALVKQADEVRANAIELNKLKAEQKAKEPPPATP
ncbi:MAG: tetratricopeptide repeat protein [Acidobacteria bacterium]|nr:tetratricopeptide repeat protein [Acidobacteriota bacterium]